MLNWVSDHGLGANKKACIPSQIALPQRGGTTQFPPPSCCDRGPNFKGSRILKARTRAHSSVRGRTLVVASKAKSCVAQASKASNASGSRQGPCNIRNNVGCGSSFVSTHRRVDTSKGCPETISKKSLAITEGENCIPLFKRTVYLKKKKKKLHWNGPASSPPPCNKTLFIFILDYKHLNKIKKQ